MVVVGLLAVVGLVVAGLWVVREAASERRAMVRELGVISEQAHERSMQALGVIVARVSEENRKTLEALTDLVHGPAEVNPPLSVDHADVVAPLDPWDDPWDESLFVDPTDVGLPDPPVEWEDAPNAAMVRPGEGRL